VAKIIADEAALKVVWNSKGASGTRPCFLCANVMAKGSGACEAHARLVDVTCSDVACFQLMTDADIWRAFDSLAAEHDVLSRADFAIAERAAGHSWSGWSGRQPSPSWMTALGIPWEPWPVKRTPAQRLRPSLVSFVGLPRQGSWRGSANRNMLEA